MQNEITERDISLTFVKGMAVLKAFDSEQTHLTLPQIVRMTGYDRAIARRLMLTLVHLGYVKQEDRTFSLTPRVLVLAAGFLQARQFGKTIEPIIRSFSTRISATISMGAIDGDHCVYLAHASAKDAHVSFGLTIGSKAPLLSSAVGRALLATYDVSKAQELIQSAPLEKLTSATNMDRNSIMSDVATTRERGYALVKGEFEEGVTAVAVAIKTHGSQPSALVVIDHKNGFENVERCEQVAEALHECAEILATLL